MDIGVIAGRFQVFHNGHLRYLREAIKRCEHLIVGITNPDPGNMRVTLTAPHRSEMSSNPLTYYERLLMLKAVCLEENISSDYFDIVPLPLDVPENMRYYIPDNAVVITTIHDEWSLEKKEELRMRDIKSKL